MHPALSLCRARLAGTGPSAATASVTLSGLRPAASRALVLLALLAALTSGCATQQPGGPAPAVAPGQETPSFTFLGEAVIGPDLPAGVRPLDPDRPAPVGGLSGLVFDPARGDYLALSDSRGEHDHGPVRMYRMAIALRAGRLTDDGARVRSVTALRDRGGALLEKGTVDPEGIALAPGGGVYVSSEGVAKDGIDPFVRRYDDDGRMTGELPLPDACRCRGGAHPRGVRDNLGFEPLTVSPPAPEHARGVRYLFTGTENALAQDGPKATVDHGSASRLLRWTLAADGTAAGPPTEWVYPVSPVAEAPTPEHPQPDGLPVAGLVELIALGPHDLLSLERSYTDGVGTTVRLYRVRLDGATEVTGRTSLAEGPEEPPAGGRARRDGRDDRPDRDDRHGDHRPVPASKTLLLDVSAALAGHHVLSDNLEGMTFGPDLPDGRRLLLLVSDDNFNHDSQRTHVVAFAVAPRVL